MIMFAIQPAKPPMMIHTMMLIASSFLEAQVMLTRIDELPRQNSLTRKPHAACSRLDAAS